MLAGERELYQRFAAYGDEELLRILTVQRAHYRPEALLAADRVLMQRRGVSPLTFIPAAVPPATPVKVKRGTKGPYQAVDFLVDALLLGFLYWVTWAMDVGSMMPESWLADGAARLLFVTLLTFGVMYLRQVWRTKEW